MEWLKKNKWLPILIGIVVLAGLASAASHSPTTNTQPVVLQNSQEQTPPPQVLTSTLSYGSSGTAVASVQQFLADEGLYTGKDTGIFDQATQNAVLAFQRQEGITPVNGVFGNAEQAAANQILAGHPDWVTYLSNTSSYTNVNGSAVHSPSDSTNGIPAGASAICGDGTYSFSMHHSGTCSHHGGVSQWLQ